MKGSLEEKLRHWTLPKALNYHHNFAQPQCYLYEVITSLPLSLHVLFSPTSVCSQRPLVVCLLLVHLVVGCCIVSLIMHRSGRHCMLCSHCPRLPVCRCVLSTADEQFSDRSYYCLLTHKCFVIPLEPDKIPLCPHYSPNCNMSGEKFLPSPDFHSQLLSTPMSCLCE